MIQSVSAIGRHRDAFTLIELLVVIAIIGVLLAVAVPAVQHVRESSRKTECLNQLHQLAVALQHHEASVGHLPKDNDRGWGVPAFLLPHLEQKPLFEALKPLSTSRSSLPIAQQSLLATAIPVLNCSSFPEADLPVAGGNGRTTYLGTAELFTRRMTLGDVIDGESQTIAFGETAGNQAWAAPGLGTAGNGPNAGSFGSYHPGGIQVTFCDGKTRFLSDHIDTATFAALCTPQGRETIGAY